MSICYRYFSEGYYLRKNPDVAASSWTGWAHFVNQGQYELRAPSPYFDPVFYRNEYPDIARATWTTPYTHFCEYGDKELRKPNAYFDPHFYKEYYKVSSLVTEHFIKNSSINLKINDKLDLFYVKYFNAEIDREITDGVYLSYFHYFVENSTEFQNFAAKYNKLIAYYPFIENAEDYSSYLNHGTVNKATLTTGHNGVCNAAYKFNGVDSYIKVADGSLFNFNNSNLTLSFWFKPDATQVDYAGILDKEHIATQKGWGIQKSSVAGCYYYFGYRQDDNGADRGWSNSYGATYKVSCNSNVWNHIAITKLGEEIKYYLNGVLQGTETTSYSDILGNGDSPLYIGYSGLGRYYKGEIDELRIYARALAESEIKELKNLSAAISFTAVNVTAKTCLESSASFKMNGIGARSYKNFDDNGYSWIIKDTDFINNGKVNIKADSNITPGTYQVTASAEDSCGNTLNGGTIDVTVEAAASTQDTEKGCTIRNHKIFDKYFNISCLDNKTLSSTPQYFHIEKQMSGKFRLDNCGHDWLITQSSPGKFLIKDVDEDQYLTAKDGGWTDNASRYVQFPETKSYWNIEGNCHFITKSQYNKFTAESANAYNSIDKKCATKVMVDKIELYTTTMSDTGTDEVVFLATCGSEKKYFPEDFETIGATYSFSANNSFKDITDGFLECEKDTINLKLSVNNKSLFTFEIPYKLYSSYPDNTKIRYKYQEDDLNGGKSQIVQYDLKGRAECEANIKATCEIDGTATCEANMSVVGEAAAHVIADMSASGELKIKCQEELGVVQSSHLTVGHPLVESFHKKLWKGVKGVAKGIGDVVGRVLGIPNTEDIGDEMKSAIKTAVDLICKKELKAEGSISGQTKADINASFSADFSVACSAAFSAKCAGEAKVDCNAQFDAKGDVTVQKFCMTFDSDTDVKVDGVANTMSFLNTDIGADALIHSNNKGCFFDTNIVKYVVDVVFTRKDMYYCSIPNDFLFLTGKTAEISSFSSSSKDIYSISLISGLFAKTYTFGSSPTQSLCEYIKIPCIDGMQIEVIDQSKNKFYSDTSLSCEDQTGYRVSKYYLDIKVESSANYYDLFMQKSDAICYSKYDITPPDSTLRISCKNDPIGNFFKLFFFWETPECTSVIDLDKTYVQYSTNELTIKQPSKGILVDKKVGFPLFDIANDWTKYKTDQLEYRADIIFHSITNGEKIEDTISVQDAHNHEYNITVVVTEANSAIAGIDQCYALSVGAIFGLGLMSADVI